jgi:hypothetical protein
VTFALWLVPVCRNTGSLLVGLAAQDAETEREQRAWVQALEPLRTNDTGLCAVLDP